MNRDSSLKSKCVSFIKSGKNVGKPCSSYAQIGSEYCGRHSGKGVKMTCNDSMCDKPSHMNGLCKTHYSCSKTRECYNFSICGHFVSKRICDDCKKFSRGQEDELLKYLQDKEKVFKVIRESTLEFFGRCRGENDAYDSAFRMYEKVVAPSGNNGVKQLLLYGEIQSGKTATMCYLSMMLSFTGIPVVILSSRFVDGVSQTYQSFEDRWNEGIMKRFISDVQEKVNLLFGRPVSLESDFGISLDFKNRNSKLSSDGMDASMFKGLATGTNSSIVHCLTHISNLSKMKTLFDSLSSYIVENKPVLLSDEADSSKNRDAGFVQILDQIKNKFSCMVDITATVWEVLAQEEDLFASNVVVIKPPPSTKYLSIRDLTIKEIPTSVKLKTNYHQSDGYFMSLLRSKINDKAFDVEIVSGSNTVNTAPKIVKHPHVLLYVGETTKDDHSEIMRCIMRDDELKNTWGCIVYNENGLTIYHPLFVAGATVEVPSNRENTKKVPIGKNKTIKVAVNGVGEGMSLMKSMLTDRYVIIAGEKAGRQINFTDLERETGVTEEYLIVANTSKIDGITQKLRILGNRGFNPLALRDSGFQFVLHIKQRIIDDIRRAQINTVELLQRAEETTIRNRVMRTVVDNTPFNPLDVARRGYSAHIKPAYFVKDTTVPSRNTIVQSSEEEKDQSDRDRLVGKMFPYWKKKDMEGIKTCIIEFITSVEPEKKYTATEFKELCSATGIRGTGDLFVHRTPGHRGYGKIMAVQDNRIVLNPLLVDAWNNTFLYTS